MGVLAAPGMLALETSPKLLPIDHENARILAEGAPWAPIALIALTSLLYSARVFNTLC